MLLDDIKRMKNGSERRPLCWQEIKALKLYARHFPEAQELLQRLQRCLQSSVTNQKNNLPPIPSHS